MSNRPNADFESILSESNIPTTEAELEIKLKEQVVAAGSKVSNDSEMSPFWRWVRAAVIVPTIWLIKTLLAGYVLPNMFIATAERWALELKAWELNVTVKAAVKTQGLITLTKATASDEVTIAKGAIIQTLPIDGVTYQLQVLADTVIAIGDETGKVLVEAMTAGLAYNLPAGYFNILPVELPGITAAVNEPDWITTSGANEETDEELALRLQNAFTSSGSWHIDDAYRAIIASVAGIRSDNIFFENTGNISPGTANAYIVMEVGETPQSLIDELNAHITEDDHHGHGDVLTCLAIADQSYDVSAEAVLADNMTQEKIDTTLLEIENRIRAAFRETEAFDEMTRAKPKSRFSVSKMASEIHSNMVTVKSIKISIDGVIQEDIVSALVQPRINTLVVSEES
ncbi:baseplate J/gp47 family protein [Psychromonas sp. SR45-3]|uniref:baseplate J/gp47 family protein n=1 Tax=Psychromonas sp. SR45-3 TaxID=2760930 RepID=UPI0015F919C8|nr:baseplate J/gp47 family protein [Psychromonas sp. SR45-3]MBB1272523.1 baseplate J/gp47 family protein [Psychromonas sp. SR45-3]